MARKFVDEGAEMWRVCVTRRKTLGTNPAYDWRTGKETGEIPYLYSDTEVYTEFFGPYKSEGAAKGQLSFRTQYRSSQDAEEIKLYANVVSGHIEKAHIIWEVAAQ
jgi:hypothetical protein